MRFVATLNRPATLGRPPATLRRASASGEVVRRRRTGGASRGTAAGLPEQLLPIAAVYTSRRWRLAQPVDGVDRRNWQGTNNLFFNRWGAYGTALERSAARDNPAQCDGECASRGVACGRCFSVPKIHRLNPGNT